MNLALSGDVPARTKEEPVVREQRLLRPEVLACQERAESLRVEADEVADAAEFWASLRTDCCTDTDPACDDPRCYRAWREYPDG